MLRRPRPGGRQNLSSPTSASKPEFNGMHPERVKELQNQGEEQAEQQVRQPSAPFGRGSMLDEEPEETNELDTMPMDKPPTGLRHKNLPHPMLPNMAAASRGHIPTADRESGAMNRHPRKGKGQGSLLYGD